MEQESSIDHKTEDSSIQGIYFWISIFLIAGTNFVEFWPWPQASKVDPANMAFLSLISYSMCFMMATALIKVGLTRKGLFIFTAIFVSLFAKILVLTWSL
ncbi:MAG: hypothetical protein KF836_03430 [Fimbriimonadaceae bacterium]|nr:hypothetical protein [Fimbriimonadaceae bacterium]